ncbi:hypothetical protein [Nannocystis pusilla]|uniref:hypothetical protein n=1 Tax=Nannocystis pusilla TaxID=889268 RepID=UPI003B7BD88D
MAKAKDLLHWGIDPQRPIPERVARIAAKVAERRGITIRDMRFDDWDAEVLRSLEVMNDAWEKNWGFVPVGREEYLHIAKDLKMVLEPGLPIIAEVKGEPVAFVITMLDVNPVLKKLDGRLFPFGIVRLLWDLKVRKVVKGAAHPARDQGRLPRPGHRHAAVPRHPPGGAAARLDRGADRLDPRGQRPGQRRREEHGRLPDRQISRVRDHAVTPLTVAGARAASGRAPVAI